MPYTCTCILSVSEMLSHVYNVSGKDGMPYDIVFGGHCIQCILMLCLL